jgi:hypothetical protein
MQQALDERSAEEKIINHERHEPHENDWILLGDLQNFCFFSISWLGSGSIYPWGAHVDLSQRIY